MMTHEEIDEIVQSLPECNTVQHFREHVTRQRRKCFEDVLHRLRWHVDSFHIEFSLDFPGELAASVDDLEAVIRKYLGRGEWECYLGVDVAARKIHCSLCVPPEDSQNTWRKTTLEEMLAVKNI